MRRRLLTLAVAVFVVGGCSDDTHASGPESGTDPTPTPSAPPAAAGRAARDEALLRAFEAGGQPVEHFADSYGMSVQEARRVLDRARARKAPRTA